MKKGRQFCMIGMSLVMLVLSQFMAVTYACQGSLPIAAQAVHSLAVKTQSCCPEMDSRLSHQSPSPFCLAHCQLPSQNTQTNYPLDAAAAFADGIVRSSAFHRHELPSSTTEYRS